MKKHIFAGVGTAIITPFANGKLDLIAFEKLLEKQIIAGIEAIVVLGTTGEPCTISNKEREIIIKVAINHCKNKCKVIVGCGSNNTELAKKYYKQAEALGADGALIVSPYYNKCTQDGIIQHYSAIAKCGNLPIIVYNVPSRTGLNILPETYVKLKQIKNIVGVKEASGNILQVLQIFKLVGEELAIYSGEDALNYVFAILGGAGTISVASNISPKLIKAIFDNVNCGNYIKAKNIQFELLPFINALFLEVNPIPVKAGLNYLGLCKNELKLPLLPMTDNNFSILKKHINDLREKYDCL